MRISRLLLAEKLAPYIVKIPQAFLDLNDPEVIEWFNYDNKWKSDINLNLAFGDAITNITNSESFETSTTASEYHSNTAELAQTEDLIPGEQYQEFKRELEQTEDLIPVIRYREFIPDIVTSDVIAVDNDFKDIRNSSTVTLDSNAGWNDQIITCNGDGSNVVVKSDIEMRYAGKKDTAFNLNREGTSIHWYLFTSGSEKFWRGS